MTNPKLEELQEDTIEKEKIVLAIHAGLAAFSITCLLRLITLPSDSMLVIFASCLFTISSICFLLIVLSKYHVFHKTKDMHIGHVIVSEDSAKHPQIIGTVCLALGFLSILLYVSVLTFLVGVVALVIAAKHHSRFKTEMNKMIGAREAVKRNKSA